ncbi:TetR/AcrR family transcriptional regulator [Roseivivax isoporae]|uniref:HTH tetR-type domain-containing protein n=1 Tax=Roseivivax isoporae LMG 25204 TaxID=1449351 RepID=X7FDR1_9RHOB|nr:TetR/AcrR family transcriptional regulator [Roseivivax isoporae]ETX31022.1 hypothetical protein RISW2_00385 [Roseivivax isoporae LMG 25204]
MSDPHRHDLLWQRKVRQCRSRRTQAALLDAAEALFAEHGLAEASVSDIAQRAGTSVGAVYHHFRDKSALYRAVILRIADEMADTNAEALDPARWDGCGIAGIAQGYLDFALKDLARSPVMRLLDSPDLREVPDLKDTILELKRRFNAGLAALFLQRREEIGHPDPDRAVAVAVDHLAAMTKWRSGAMIWPQQSAPLDVQTYIDEVLRGFSCYLQLKRH